MKEKSLLVIDAVINLILGSLLLFFPSSVADLLGVPPITPRFYPAILGAMLFGIGLALLIERFRFLGLTGLGLGGAVAINLSGGIVLSAWLLFGGLELPVRGLVFLWGLVIILVGISTTELIAKLR
jgi:hypothetical protein